LSFILSCLIIAFDEKLGIVVIFGIFYILNNTILYTLIALITVMLNLYFKNDSVNTAVIFVCISVCYISSLFLEYSNLISYLFLIPITHIAIFNSMTEYILSTLFGFFMLFVIIILFIKRIKKIEILN
jgi:hypothetical protein